MSLAYKVEELLALRDSVSESAVSIDKFADEDVIKGQFPAFTPHCSLHFFATTSFPKECSALQRSTFSVNTLELGLIDLPLHRIATCTRLTIPPIQSMSFALLHLRQPTWPAGHQPEAYDFLLQPRSH
jgi:hypothetical protein